MIKTIFRNWHRYVFTALLSVILWAWIFTLLFNAPPKHKVVLYADLPALDGNGLSILLEEDLPDGIRRVEANTMGNMIFDEEAIPNGDLYLIRDGNAKDALPAFSPIDPAAFPGETFFESDGKAYGILVYDEAAGLCVAGDVVFYLPGERCWLFFSKDSAHVGAWNGSPDDGAIVIAQHFLKLR